jgi:dynein heavy chain 1
MLTLPSGERMSIPDNMRIILEVDSLNYATPATVSRCGMVWFSEDTVTSEMCLEHVMATLAEEDIVGDRGSDQETPPAQTHFLNVIRPLVMSERTSSLVMDALEFALAETHVMAATRDRLLHTIRALLVQGIGLAIAYDENHPDFPMTGEHMEKFAKRWLLHSLMWSFCGSASWESRKKFGGMLLRTSGVMMPEGDEHSLVDYRVRVEDGEYELWSDSVPRMEIESHRVSATDVVITTTDTVRHSEILGAWLDSRIPLVLCGPPGSGKVSTTTLYLVLLYCTIYFVCYFVWDGIIWKRRLTLCIALLYIKDDDSYQRSSVDPGCRVGKLELLQSHNSRDYLEGLPTVLQICAPRKRCCPRAS